MRNERDIHKENHNTDQAQSQNRKSGRHIPIVLSSAVILVVFCICWIISYSLISERILQFSINNMEELTEHDERTVLSGLNNKHDVLYGIAQHLRHKECDTTEQLLANLTSCKQFMECIGLSLIADDGYVMNSDRALISDEAMWQLCDGKGLSDWFISGSISPGGAPDDSSQEIMLGVKITPFTIEGTTYTYIIARLKADAFQDELKIDCYDGRGYSSVIDAEGKYIVKIDRNSVPHVSDNFYNEMRSSELRDGSTLQNIQSRMMNRDSFTIEYNRRDGVECVMAFSPMEGTDWYFTICVPMSVFREQSMSLMVIFTILMLVLLISVGIVVVVSMRRRKRLSALEKRHHKEISEALVLAEQASRAKTTFLNNMSHDIRTPMNAIIGFTALASTHIDNKERVEDYLGKIAHSSTHLLSLINDVLDMSRIESGKMHIEEKPENLSEIIHDLRTIIQADIHANQQEFFIDTVDVTDEDILCDKLRLNQVLLNLLSNAVKYTPPRGMISVRIIQKGTSKPGYGEYEFIVKDTGMGMTKEFLSTIFEPFTRGRNSTISGIQGTGLGMSITKNIIDMMGGTIQVSSEVGAGTEVVVCLEFKLYTKHRKVQVIPSLEGVRALVVDDDINACQSVSQMLRDIGMRAEWTMYGKEAVVRTEEAIKLGDPYKVYLIDWLMPDLNGVETVRRIRKVAGTDVPIIVLSAYDWVDIEDEAKEAGVTDFISKPLFHSDLRRLLMKLSGQGANNEPDGEPEVDFHGRRLLLVEDNELNREIATEILKQAGFVIETAENGKESVEMVAGSEPGYYDVVLMDIQMPVMDGYEASRKIRELSDPGLAGIPIIALTANAFEEDKKLAFEAGMNAHVGKPINVPVLFETLKQMIP